MRRERTTSLSALTPRANSSRPVRPYQALLLWAIDQPPNVRPERITSAECMICHAPYHRVHIFYGDKVSYCCGLCARAACAAVAAADATRTRSCVQFCPACSQLNWSKRNATADLTGRVALVTGGRIKIGCGSASPLAALSFCRSPSATDVSQRCLEARLETALILLRCGATVYVTSRFPKDAARRYSEVAPSFTHATAHRTQRPHTRAVLTPQWVSCAGEGFRGVEGPLAHTDGRLPRHQGCGGTASKILTIFHRVTQRRVRVRSLVPARPWWSTSLRICPDSISSSTTPHRQLPGNTLQHIATPHTSHTAHAAHTPHTHTHTHTQR